MHVNPCNLEDYWCSDLDYFQQTLKNLCTDLKTKQLISTPTTKYNTIIDHLHTNITDFQKVGVIKTYYSDHDQIFILF